MSAVNVPNLLVRLRSRLPDYMMPARVTLLDHLPLTPAGKSIDSTRAAIAGRPTRSLHHLPAVRCGVRSSIAWPPSGRSCSGASSARPTDDLFRLGGHSLLAAGFVSRIRMEYGALFPLKKLFEDPLAASGWSGDCCLGSDRDPGGDLVRSEHSRIPLSFQQERVWRIEREGSSAAARNKVHAWSIQGVLDGEALAQSATRWSSVTRA